MAGITSTGIDVATIVTQLVAAEKATPQKAIDTQRSAVTTQLSAIGSLKSSLSALRDALAGLKSGAAFGARTATSSNTAVFTATAGSGAASGRYDIEVVNLAQAQKSASAAYASSSAVVGTGTLSVSVGGTTMDLAIGSNNNTLAGIRDAINRASDNPGVNATIVNGSDGARLVLTSRETGVEKAFTLSASGGDGGLDTLVSGMASLTTASDALVRVDGFDVTSASNVVTTAIDGVTLNLASSRPGETLALDIGTDGASMKTSLEAFVTAYNNFVTLNKQLTSFDATTNRKGALIGDSTLRSISSTLSRMVGGNEYGSGAEGALASLSQVGLQLQVDGKLKLDGAKFDAALAAGPERVSALFTGANGVGTLLTGKLDDYLRSDGVFATRTENLTQRNRQLDASQDRLDARMLTVEARLRTQYTALDSLLASFNSTSAFLTQQLESLNKSS